MFSEPNCFQILRQIWPVFRQILSNYTKFHQILPKKLSNFTKFIKFYQILPNFFFSHSLLKSLQNFTNFLPNLCSMQFFCNFKVLFKYFFSAKYVSQKSQGWQKLLFPTLFLYSKTSDLKSLHINSKLVLPSTLRCRK